MFSIMKVLIHNLTLIAQVIQNVIFSINKNLVKFTGKYMCQSLFFNKVAGHRPATLFKKDFGTGVFL